MDRNKYTQELRELLDKEAIRDLIQAYCNAADRHDFEKMRSLYHPDAYDDHGIFSQGLASDFIDRLPQIQAPMQILHHNVTTINLRLEGDYAEGEVYLIAMHKVRTSESSSYEVLIGGRYLDKYERRGGRWKFAHRAVVADWAHAHTPSIIDLEHPMLAGAHIGRPGRDDPSYGFFRLFRFGE